MSKNMSFREAYGLLDRPEILQFVFYPRSDSSQAPPGATDHVIAVDDGAAVGCRFYTHNPGSPTILFFHGNGEVASDYDTIAPLYHQLGINLFVADYRGYGSSSGIPSFTAMVGDTHHIFPAFLDILNQAHYTGDVFVMGRSLGSISAIELASVYPDHIKGLIIESGFASIIRLLTHLGLFTEFLELHNTAFPNAVKMRSVTLPTLILHGEHDTLIPTVEAHDLYNNAAASQKRLVIIDGANHNDIMMVGAERYFREIRELIFGDGTPGASR